MMSSFKKGLLIVIGSLSLVLGVIGIFLPLLPTTPFLLLSATCYVHSSQSLHRRLMNHPVLGPDLRNYMEHRSVAKRTKLRALILLWLGLAVSAYMSCRLPVSVILLLVGIAVSIHICSLKTLTEED